jgi:hypothetical protein
MLHHGLRASCLIALVLLLTPPAGATSPSAVLDRLGLLGASFAPDCARPVSPQNPFTFFRPIDGNLVQIDLMVGPAQRQYSYVIDRAVALGAGGLSTSMVNAYRRLNLSYAVDGTRLRTMESVRAGDQVAIVTRGTFTATGRPTLWLTRCSGLPGST